MTKETRPAELNASTARSKTLDGDAADILWQQVTDGCTGCLTRLIFWKRKSGVIVGRLHHDHRNTKPTPMIRKKEMKSSESAPSHSNSDGSTIFLGLKQHQIMGEYFWCVGTQAFLDESKYLLICAFPRSLVEIGVDILQQGFNHFSDALHGQVLIERSRWGIPLVIRVYIGSAPIKGVN